MIKELIEQLSPILLKPTSSSITISLSRRFFLFNMLNRAVKYIENEPYLNFISLLKNYKVLGRILSGDISDLHRDRNTMYFKNFFPDKNLYALVKSDLEEVYKINKNLKVTLTRRGLIIYDNYKRNTFNVLLLTIHSGTWVPEWLDKKLAIDKNFRYTEEDVEADRLYRDLVLKKGGIWIDNKQSRFACDYNRKPHRVIYNENSERWLKRKIWHKQPDESEIANIMTGYKEFYFTLARIVDAYRFNIIFDGHTMKDTKTRPNMSFGVKYVPKFYMPIVKSMQNKLIKRGLSPVYINKPYVGGNIVRWLNVKFPDIFIFSMEVNKKMYMNKTRTVRYLSKIKKIARDITELMNIEVDKDDIHKS